MVGFPYLSRMSDGSGKRRRSFLRRLLIVGVVLCVVIGAGGIGLGWWLPGIVAAEVGRLTNTQVKTGSLGFRWDGSVSIHQLSIRPQQDDPGSDSTIFRAEDVQVRFSRRSLLSLSPRVTELYIEDFVLDVQRDLDRQRWASSATPPARGARGSQSPRNR